jgi:hypothetical protein
LVGRVLVRMNRTIADPRPGPAAGLVAVVMAVVIVADAVADVLAAALDPRIRMTGAA